MLWGSGFSFHSATIRAMTNINGIIKQLEQERDRIDSAIQALKGVS